MAVTGWMWDDIQRVLDEVTVGGVKYRRKNWRAIRHRMSNDEFTSELGDTATTLTANNGGVAHPVDSPESDGIILDGFTIWDYEDFTLDGSGSSLVNGYYNRDIDLYNGAPWWTQSQTGEDMFVWYNGSGTWYLTGTDKTTTNQYFHASGAADSDISSLSWVQDGSYTIWTSFVWDDIANLETAGIIGDTASYIQTGTRNGYPYYTMVSPPEYGDPTRQPLLWYSATDSRWGLAMVSTDSISSEDWDDDISTHYDNTYDTGYLYGEYNVQEIDGNTFTGLSYWGAVNNGSALETVINLPFTCTEDTPTFPNPFSSWHKQTQNWTYVEPYSQL